jgi:CRP-like cAMP-binding protein
MRAVALLRRDARVEMLRRVPLLARCSRADLQELASVAEELEYRPGRVVVREGDRKPRDFFMLLAGEAEVRRGERKVGQLRAGDFFGEFAMLTHQPRNATVVTTAPTRALVVRERDFVPLLKRNAPMALRLMEALAQRVPPTEHD